MKKTTIVIMCITLLVLSALPAFASISPYTNALSMVPQTSIRPQVRQLEGCSTQIDTSTGDIYFLRKARQECVDENRHNLNCQKHCFEQVKLMTHGTMMGQPMGAYSRYGCNDVEPLNVNTRSQCYFEASSACNAANPGHNYCIKKCVQKAYNQCRQSLIWASRGSA